MLSSKIVTLSGLKKISNTLLQKRKKIVLVSGCFDIFHLNHLRFLQEAKKRGNVLIVGLLADRFINQRKGSKRPIFREKERAEVLDAISFVDWITIVDRSKVEKLVESAQPNMYVVGGDRKGKSLPEAVVLEKYGVAIAYTKQFEGDSTTQLIKKVQAKNAVPD